MENEELRNQEQENQNQDNQQQEEEKAPTIEELMAELAQERAEKERMKNAFDKSSSEAANFKKQLRAKQTAEEQEEEAKKEREEQQKQYVTGLEKELSTIKATERYMGLGMAKDLAAETAAAELEGDSDKVMANMQKHMATVVQEKESEWLKNRPDVQAGNEEDKEEEDAFLKGFNS